MTQLLDDLRALDALFSDESKWKKGVYARDARGTQVGSRCVDAVCWCLAGGRLTVSRGDMKRDQALVAALCDALPQGTSTSTYIDWQDDPCRQFSEIKSLIARAIATEEGRVTDAILETFDPDFADSFERGQA